MMATSCIVLLYDDARLHIAGTTKEKVIYSSLEVFDSHLMVPTLHLAATFSSYSSNSGLLDNVSRMTRIVRSPLWTVSIPRWSLNKLVQRYENSLCGKMEYACRNLNLRINIFSNVYFFSDNIFTNMSCIKHTALIYQHVIFVQEIAEKNRFRPTAYAYHARAHFFRIFPRFFMYLPVPTLIMAAALISCMVIKRTWIAPFPPDGNEHVLRREGLGAIRKSWNRVRIATDRLLSIKMPISGQLPCKNSNGRPWGVIRRCQVVRENPFQNRKAHDGEM